MLVCLAVGIPRTIAAEQKLDEAAALAKLELFGAQVQRASKLPGNPVVTIAIADPKFNDKYLSLLHPFRA